VEGWHGEQEIQELQEEGRKNRKMGRGRRVGSGRRRSRKKRTRGDRKEEMETEEEGVGEGYTVQGCIHTYIEKLVLPIREECIGRSH
jgi:hypothetical protein